jgi:uncharacterized protein YrrD
MLKLRNLVKLPLLDGYTAEKLGEIDKVIIGSDFRVLYLVMFVNNKQTCRVSCDDVVINDEAILIYDRSSIKMFQDGEQLSIYDTKLGDLVFDDQGKELGTVSDLIIDCENKEVWGVEVSGGIMQDLLDGRSELPLAQLTWASSDNAIYDQEGNEQ